jgi:hypothetical protein
MKAAETRVRGDTSPMKKTGSIAIHTPILALRDIALIWRADPGGA